MLKSDRPERQEELGHTQPYEPVTAVERGGQSCALMTPAAVSGMGRTGDLLEVAALLRDDVYLGEWQQAWRGGKR